MFINRFNIITPLLILLLFTIMMDGQVYAAVPPQQIGTSVNASGVPVSVPVELHPSEGSVWIKMFVQILGNDAVDKIVFGKDVGNLSSTGSIFMSFISVLLVVVLAGGGVLITFNMVMGTYNTATQGEFLGKKWETWMVPMRTLGSIFALIPMPAYGGLALVQVFMISSIGIGIGFADSAWKTMVTDMVRNRTPITAQVADPGIENTIKAMLFAKVCILSLEGKDGAEKNDPLSHNYYKESLSNKYAAFKANDFMIERVKAVSGTMNEYTWYLGAVADWETKQSMNGQVLSIPSSSSTCGMVSFKSGTVAVPSGDITSTNSNGSLRNGKVIAKADILSALRAESMNAVTKNNRQRMLNIWKSPILNAIALKTVQNKLDNPLNDADYVKLQVLYAQIQKSVMSDVDAAGFSPNAVLTKNANTKNLEDQLIKVLTSEGSIMAGSLYWTLNEVTNITDSMFSASALSTIDMSAVQQASANDSTTPQGSISSSIMKGAAVGGGLAAIGWAALAFTTGPVGWGLMGLAAITASATGGALISGINQASNTLDAAKNGDVSITPDLVINGQDLARMGRNQNSLITLFNRMEIEHLSSFSQSGIGTGLNALAQGRVNNKTTALINNQNVTPQTKTALQFQSKTDFFDYQWKQITNSKMARDKDWGTYLAESIQLMIVQGSGSASINTTVNGTSQVSIVKSDPMREMRFLGNGLLTLGGAIFAGSALASMVGGVGGGAMSTAASKIGGMVGLGKLTGMLMVVVSIVGVALLSLGLMLAFIIPALPYTTWTLSLLTYLIVFAEAMVAALFWALAHAWPEGEGLSSQLASKGWMLYLQVMMTPILMLGGFWIGAQIVFVMGWWVDNTLWSTLQLAYDGSSTTTGYLEGFGANVGVFGMIGHLIVYTGLMFAIVWKSFDMTAELKNWVFEWIGGSPRAMGENQMQSQHLMGVVGGAKSTVDRAVSSSTQASARQPKSNGGGDDTNKQILSGIQDIKKGQGGGGGNVTPKKEEGN